MTGFTQILRHEIHARRVANAELVCMLAGFAVVLAALRVAL